MMESGQQLMDWLTEQQAQEHRIWLEEPEVVKEGGMLSKSFVRYTICYMQDKKLVRVKHRYSEFEMVQQALVGMYGPLGMLVPAIPGKKLVNNQSAEFILSRMRGLTIFCEQVVENPYLRNDNLWKEFLNPNNTAFTKDTIFAATNHTSIGSLRWLEAVDRSLQTPEEPTLRFDQMLQECQVTEKNLKTLCDALRSHINNLRALNNSVASINNALLQWVDSEGADVTALNGAWTPSTPLAEIDHPKSNLTTAAQLFSAHHAAASKIPDSATYLVLDHVEYQLAQVQELRDMGKIRNDYESAIEKLSLKLHKLEQADGSKWEQLTEVRQQLQDKSEGLLKFYRGFFNHTLPEYVVDRAAAVREAMATLGLIVLAPAANIQTAGQTFFKQMQVAPTTTFQNAVVVLDRLALPPLDEFPMVVPAEEVRLTAPPPPALEEESKSPAASAPQPVAKPASPVSQPTAAPAAAPAAEEPVSGTATARHSEEEDAPAAEPPARAESPVDTTPSRKNEIMADLLKDSKYESKSDLWD